MQVIISYNMFHACGLIAGQVAFAYAREATMRLSLWILCTSGTKRYSEISPERYLNSSRDLVRRKKDYKIVIHHFLIIVARYYSHSLI